MPSCDVVRIWVSLVSFGKWAFIWVSILMCTDIILRDPTFIRDFKKQHCVEVFVEHAVKKNKYVANVIQ